MILIERIENLVSYVCFLGLMRVNVVLDLKVFGGIVGRVCNWTIDPGQASKGGFDCGFSFGSALLLVDEMFCSVN